MRRGSTSFITAVVLLTVLGAPARAVAEEGDEEGPAKRKRHAVESLRAEGEEGPAKRQQRRVARASRKASALAPLSSDTLGAGSSPVPQIVATPAALSLTIDGDFELGGFVFKSGLPFLHNDGGAGFGNTALGLYALVSTTPGVPYSYYGARNTAVGQSALRDNTTGYSNTATGHRALGNNTVGYFNTASGDRALYYNSTGRWNTASGNRALYYNTTGIDNTASGSSALGRNTAGHYNTATGSYALYYNTTGSRNTGTGTSALGNNTTGYSNTAMGRRALSGNTTGSHNTASGNVALLSTLAARATPPRGALHSATRPVPTTPPWGTTRSTTTGAAPTIQGLGTRRSTTTPPALETPLLATRQGCSPRQVTTTSFSAAAL